MNPSSGVEISSERLYSLVEEAIKVHKGYNRNHKYYYYDKWSWRKLRYVKAKCFEYPSWAYPHSGVLSRLEELKTIAEGVTYSEKIFLSELTFLNLMLLLNRSDKFQKDIFVMRY